MPNPLATSALCLFAAAFTVPAATITNGGFETGNLNGWTLTNGSAFDVVCADGSTVGTSTCVAHGGTFAMTFGSFQSTATLSQNVATVGGSVYQLSFFLAMDTPNSQEDEIFSVRWGGTTVFSLANPAAAFPYGQRVILNLAATQSSTLLEFNGQHDFTQWFLDDVSIADNAVPEPAPLALMSLGGLAIYFSRRR